jgi:hypothetical protein
MDQNFFAAWRLCAPNTFFLFYSRKDAKPQRACPHACRRQAVVD